MSNDFSNNPDFYPTPFKTFLKMKSKIQDEHEIKRVLEPSAGKGTLIDYMEEYFKYTNKTSIFAIEKDPTLQAVLRGNNKNILDSDFLEFNSGEQFDLIFANFPFSDGEHHLLKAMDYLYSGQIVALINAQTLKNPHSNARKMLVHKLKEVGAEIEYLTDEFTEAERTTPVEVALVYIDQRRKIEDLFGDIEKDTEEGLSFEQSHSLDTSNSIKGLVQSFESRRIRIQQVIIEFYQNHAVFNGVLELKVIGINDSKDTIDLTEEVTSKYNFLVKRLKEDYWSRVLELPEVRKKITNNRKSEFLSEIEKWKTMAFSENNIRQFIINLIELYPKTIKNAIDDIFEEFTRYAFYNCEDYKKMGEKNILHFNAWKTNNGYKINEKVIVPIRFYDYDGKSLNSGNYERRELLEDIESVLGYFGKVDEIGKMNDVCVEALKEGKNKKIDTKFFEVSIFKKGTIHLRFKDLDILRKFNIEACRNKGWLPHDYAQKDFSQMNEEEKETVRNFEGENNYSVVNTDYLQLANVSPLALVHQDQVA
ncbi:DUF4942 domain-containing protein [Halobacteriovorax sp. ZH2_bin.1]|uniref:DUF4942 domain-containing protein n=1 Tax=Halobacteriovorax sp. ZH2_bin.1 TaxID=3157724 RepID=UPI0037121E19